MKFSLYNKMSDRKRKNCTNDFIQPQQRDNKIVQKVL